MELPQQVRSQMEFGNEEKFRAEALRATESRGQVRSQTESGNEAG
jgi:hypothetical protein